MPATRLKQIREGLRPKLSQEQMARLSDVTLATYRNAENGENCSFSTASAILEAINGELSKRGQTAVGIFDLGLSIV